MAKRKTATRTGGTARRPKTARKRAGASTTMKGGRSTGKTRSSGRSAASKKAAGRRAGAGKNIPTRGGAAKGSTARRQSSGRQRKRLAEVTDEVQERWDMEEEQERWDMEEEDVPTPPSTLDLDRHASAARTGRSEMAARRRKHTAASPAITGGDVDADWEGAYFVGDESATGDNPTPDQAAVEDIGRAVGVDYEDTEELKSTPKIDRRDKKRWELDPASSEDYKDRNKRRGS